MAIRNRAPSLSAFVTAPHSQPSPTAEAAEGHGQVAAEPADVNKAALQDVALPASPTEDSSFHGPLSLHPAEKDHHGRGE